MVRTYFKREEWGFTHWRNGVQVGASVGVSLAEYIGRDLTPVEARLWRRGVALSRSAP